MYKRCFVVVCFEKNGEKHSEKTEREARREKEAMKGEVKGTEDMKDPEDTKEEEIRAINNVRLFFSLLFGAILLGLFFVWQLL